MKTYLYLSLFPEALVASMLSPDDFGTYLAVGTQKRTRGQAMFFEVGDLKGGYFQLKEVEKRCVPHPDGTPKHSVYFSVYRVLENVALEAIESLYLVTQDGRVLKIEKGTDLPQFPKKYHLYQEICPVHPRIVSSLDPIELTRHITDKKQFIHLPKVCFVDLRLGELAEDPAGAVVRDLPYTAIEHLRDCLLQLKNNPEKRTKIVDRIHPQTFPYRSVENGVFIGSSRELLFYPFPSEQDLKSRYFDWWRSASIMGDLG